MNFENYNIPEYSVHSARALADLKAQNERKDRERIANENANIARIDETLELHKSTIEEIRQIKKLQSQSDLAAKTREDKLSKSNITFNVLSLLIALASLAVALIK